jgi:putative heme iron utilization protein
MNKWSLAVALVAAMLLTTAPVLAGGLCATPEQAAQIGEFYDENPGMLPVLAARRLGMPAAVVASALEGELIASAPADAFAEVWAAMAGFGQANFLIMVGANVFEILSGVAPGAPSTRSQYFNLEYAHPLRGHLRPDLYSSIYAIAMPGNEDTVVRGVMFFDADGGLVFGVFISGESLDPTAEDLAKFADVMALVRSKPPACAAAG